MRTLKIVVLLALLALGGSFAVNRVEAAPLQGAAAIGQVADQNTLRQDAAYVCRRVWTRGGWRRACHWTPGPFAYAYPFAYRPYYWGPYPRRYWAHRYWHGRRYWR